MRRTLVTIGLLAALLVIYAAVADGARRPGLKVVNRLGPNTPTAPQDFSTAVARCPRGYVATGGGSYGGAVDDVTAGPTTNGKGWEVDGFNPSDTTVYKHSAIVVCVRGNKRLSVKAAAVHDRVKQAERDYLATHKH